MIADPERRGASLAEFHFAVSPRLWDEIVASGALSAPAPAARDEWECFALYACVRGLVAAGGFNRETARAVDALHEAVLTRWAADDEARFDERRGRVAERYAEYGGIGEAGGASGAATVTARLGAACAAHLASAPADGLAELVGALHETLAEGAAEAVRCAE